MIVPSIDLSEGKVVQWRRGREPVMERGDAEALARRYGRHGEVAVVDLDAALGKGDNTEQIAKLCRIAPCRVGGGIRTVERARLLLKAGARRLVIGTRATPDFLSQLPRDLVLAAIDEDGGQLVDEGWRRQTGRRTADRVAELRPYVSGFVYTAVDRTGGLGGADVGRFRAFAALTDLPVTVAGGIASAEEVFELDRMGLDCQVGMALHTGAVDLTEAFVRCVDFEKGGGLVPAVVRDVAGRTRMQAWMSPAALRATLQSGQVHFWSRRRQALWRKGEESGHELLAREVRPDCDRDAIHVVADAVGATCHLGRESCFGDDAFSLADLEAVLRERLRQAVGDSYTRRLASDPGLLRDKLLEEAGELAEASGEQAVAHEAADVLYHVMAVLAARQVPLARVLSELNGRRTWSAPGKGEGE